MDVQDPRGRDVPRRRAAQRRGGLLQLRPLVQLQGPLQNPSATYYWQVVFGGFKTYNPDSGAPEESLYKSCEATDESTAVLTLTKPSATFIPALSQQSFSIASPKALTDYDADAGTVDADGVFSPTGTFGTEHPIGTGPFKFESWTRNDRLCSSGTMTTGATRPCSTS